MGCEGILLVPYWPVSCRGEQTKIGDFWNLFCKDAKIWAILQIFVEIYEFSLLVLLFSIAGVCFCLSDVSFSGSCLLLVVDCRLWLWASRSVAVIGSWWLGVGCRVLDFDCRCCFSCRSLTIALLTRWAGLRLGSKLVWSWGHKEISSTLADQ